MRKPHSQSVIVSLAGSVPPTKPFAVDYTRCQILDLSTPAFEPLGELKLSLGFHPVISGMPRRLAQRFYFPHLFGYWPTSFWAVHARRCVHVVLRLLPPCPRAVLSTPSFPCSACLLARGLYATKAPTTQHFTVLVYCAEHHLFITT